MQCDWKALRNAVTVMPGTKSSEGAVEIVLPGRQYACGNAHVLWRSAFQARRPRLAFPGTAYPVTKKLRFCSAFQALSRKSKLYYFSFYTAIQHKPNYNSSNLLSYG